MTSGYSPLATAGPDLSMGDLRFALEHHHHRPAMPSALENVVSVASQSHTRIPMTAPTDDAHIVPIATALAGPHLVPPQTPNPSSSHRHAGDSECEQAQSGREQQATCDLSETGTLVVGRAQQSRMKERSRR